jgi:hypothetical protein
LSFISIMIAQQHILACVHYTNRYMDAEYKVCGRSYQSNTQSSKMYLLKDRTIERIREIIRLVDVLLGELNIEYNISGGTLLGAIKHGTIPIHFDDTNTNIHVDIKHKNLLFSHCFDVNQARKHGLRTIFLNFNNAKEADKPGAICRFQLDDSEQTPVLDVSFTHITTDGRYIIKLDGWQNNYVLENDIERCPIDTILPRYRQVVDGLAVWLPSRPRDVLIKQYGAKVFDSLVNIPLSQSCTPPSILLHTKWHPPT